MTKMMVAMFVFVAGCLDMVIDLPSYEPPPGCVPIDEICNGEDDDCDGEMNEGLVNMGPCGLPSVGECEDGHLMCTDGAITCVNAVLPTEEVCDGLDNDCDDETDEGCGECETSTDCDDGDDCTVDLCEVGGICRHTSSDDPACEPACATETRYRDEDGDDYGDPEFSGVVCVDAPPVEGARVAGDCNDSDATVHPNADEICDELDNDCDGETDEGCPPVCGDRACNGDETCATCSRDCGTCTPFCGDGICADFALESCNTCPADCGSCSSVCGDRACNDDETYVSCPIDCGSCVSSADCDDGDECTMDLCVVGGICHYDRYADPDCALCIPNDEVCNGLDDDCDGNFDEGLFVVYYLDHDRDGWGDPAWFVQYACPDAGDAGGVPNRGDCDDSDPEIHPGAGCPECEMIYFQDLDGDAFGDPTSGRVFSCDEESPAGYVPTIGDCDDSDSAVHRNALEVCNGLDDDCDTTVDEDCVP